MTYQRLQTVLSKMGPPPKPTVALSDDTVKGSVNQLCFKLLFL